MLDRGTLNRRKLQWAAEKAKWPDVRRAAQRLIEELDQLAPPITPVTSRVVEIVPLAATPAASPRVVNASTYLGNQEALHSLLVVYYLGIGAGIFITTLTALAWLLRGQIPELATLVLVANALICGFLIALIRRRHRLARSYYAGRKGEDQVAKQLCAALDQRWTIYRNLQVPGRKDDLDLILVGPGGVWAVQVKATRAPLRVEAGQWQVRRGGRWVVAKPDPARQVTRQATALNHFFKRSGLARFVERAIALAEPQPFDQFAPSEIPVWLPFELERRAQELATRYPPDAGELARIHELLGRRAVEQRAAEEARSRRRR
jgi:hypothetical protein